MMQLKNSLSYIVTLLVDDMDDFDEVKGWKKRNSSTLFRKKRENFLFKNTYQHKKYNTVKNNDFSNLPYIIAIKIVDFLDLISPLNLKI